MTVPYRRFLRFEGTGGSRGYDLLREDLLDLALHFLRQKKRTTRSQALIIPPCETPGSLGDFAMISVAVRELQNAGCKRIDLASGYQWPLDPPADGAFDFEPHSGFRRKLETMRRLADYDYVCLIGADVIHGVYGDDVLDRISLLALAARLGCVTSVLGASFSDAAREPVVQALRGLPASVGIHARDPISRARMEHRLGRHVTLSADLAALLPEDNGHPDLPSASGWIDAHRQAGRRIIGINAYDNTENSGAELVEALECMTRLLGNEQCAFVLIPHDQRDEASDIATLLKLHQRLNAADVLSYFLPANSVITTKAVLSRLDLVVTRRMHAAILAMSSGTPAIGIPYNGKFEGLYAMMGVADEDLLIDLADLVRDPRKTAARVIAALDSQSRLRDKLAAALPSYRAGSFRNFGNLPDWSDGDPAA